MSVTLFVLYSCCCSCQATIILSISQPQLPQTVSHLLQYTSAGRGNTGNFFCQTKPVKGYRKPKTNCVFTPNFRWPFLRAVKSIYETTNLWCVAFMPGHKLNVLLGPKKMQIFPAAIQNCLYSFGVETRKWLLQPLKAKSGPKELRNEISTQKNRSSPFYFIQFILVYFGWPRW